MTMGSLSFRTEEHGSTLLLDGNDISSMVGAVTITATASGTNTASLSLFVRGDVSVDPVDVTVDERTARLLIALGWTPPEEEPTP